MSFVITRAAGKKNQTRPSRTLFMMKWACTTMIRSAMCVHANCVNWNLRCPLFREPTKKTNPVRMSVSTRNPALSRSRSCAAFRLTDDIKHEADEPVVRGQRQEHLINKDDVLEIVDDTLAVEEVHGGGKPVPVQALGRAELTGSGGDACDGDDLLEGDDLDDGDDEDDVYVAHEEGGEEAADHEKRPYCPRYEVLLLLFVIVLGGWSGVFLQIRRIVSTAKEGCKRSVGRCDSVPSPSRRWHTSAIWPMCGDDLALGEPSWLASLCSLKLARRPSTLPLPFLWANFTPLRPFPIVNKVRTGRLSMCLCGGL